MVSSGLVDWDQEEQKGLVFSSSSPALTNIIRWAWMEPGSKVQQQNSANWLILLAKLKNHTFDQSFKILIKVDLRTITLGVPPQEVRNRIWAQTKCLQCICTNDVFTMYLQMQLQLFQVLTRDSVTISVDAVVYYRVSNSTLCKTSVENAHHSTMLLSQVAIPKNWFKTIILNKIHNFLIMITTVIKIKIHHHFQHNLSLVSKIIFIDNQVLLFWSSIKVSEMCSILQMPKAHILQTLLTSILGTKYLHQILR